MKNTLLPLMTRGIIILGFAAGCATTQTPEETQSNQPASAPTSDQDQAEEHAVAELTRNFQRVHFDFDSASLSNQSLEALTANIEIMSKHPDIALEVQGHCDERGTTDYNLSLGARRAEAIRKYMVNSGIQPDRIATLSYGHQRPLEDGRSAEAWAQNRRAEFRIVRTKSEEIHGTTIE